MRKIGLALLLLLCSLTLSAQYNVKAMMEEGRATLDKGYYLLSMEIFSRIIFLKPEMYEPWFLRGKSKYHLDDFGGAVSDCTEAISRNPYIADIFDLRAMSNIRVEQFDSAAVDYTRALDIMPDNREYWYNRAYCYYRGGQHQLALEQLDYILSRWPRFREAITLRRDILSGRPLPPSQPSSGDRLLRFSTKFLPPMKQ